MTSTFSLSRQQYPDPFLDVAGTKLPKSQKKLLKLLYLFATTHPQISPIVKKLAKYPITQVIVNSENNSAAVEKKWRDALEGEMNIYEKAEAMGLDFFGYGNCFITVHKPFIRYYKCKSCENKNVAGKLKYFINNKRFIGKCPSCNKRTSFQPVDDYTEAVSDIAIVRIPPEEMFIKHNELTGKSFYYRDVPSSLKKALNNRKPDREIIDSTPWTYIKAAMHKKKIRFDKGKVLHLKEPSLSGNNMEWGMPIIMASLKDAYLNQIYKKADESVANERVVPARFVYPQPTNNDPMRTISLARFSSFMSKSLRRWRQDKNAVMVSPFPIGVAEMGGDAQRLMTANLRQLTIKEIIGSTGVPEGFLGDGMTWSGGSVQLRMLENMIMSYKRALDKLLRFVVGEMSKITDWPSVDVSFKPFRMADDIQMLQILIQLAQMKHVSFKEILERIDLDWDEENKKVEKETKAIQEIMLQETLLEVKSMLKSVEYQVESQNRQNSTTDMLNERDSTEEATSAHLRGIQSMEDYHEEKTEQDQQAQQEEGEEEEQAEAVEQRLDNARAEKYEAEAATKEDKVTPVVQSIARKLSAMSPEQQEKQLELLAERAPALEKKVRVMLEQSQQQEEGPEQQEEVPQQEEGDGSPSDLLGKIRAESNNPKEMADRIMMLPGKKKTPIFELLQKEDPQLAIRVMKELQKGYSKSGGKSSGGGGVDMTPSPQQKPPRRK